MRGGASEETEGETNSTENERTPLLHGVQCTAHQETAEYAQRRTHSMQRHQIRVEKDAKKDPTHNTQRLRRLGKDAGKTKQNMPAL